VGMEEEEEEEEEEVQTEPTQHFCSSANNKE
jgi:hypothetical protein